MSDSGQVDVRGNWEMANERITEDMVEAQLRSLGFYDDEEAIIVEKQQSTVVAIRKALSKASKRGKGGEAIRSTLSPPRPRRTWS
ncbi:hypothetical protein [Nanchangia anserum]|uniref:hypothetical protein n=1 Tax=Nanchangia anserum TaxID=2692125 RepID=UPI001D115F1E|nr:hypothetical protein [Nanchangia anserum]